MPPLFFASLDVPYPCHERQKHSGEPSSRLETVWRGFPKWFTPRFAIGRAAGGPSHGACMSACPTRHTGPLSGPKHTETKIRIGKSSNKVIVYRKESRISFLGLENIIGSQGVVAGANRNCCKLRGWKLCLVCGWFLRSFPTAVCSKYLSWVSTHSFPSYHTRSYHPGTSV